VLQHHFISGQVPDGGKGTFAMAYSELIKDINRIRACIRNFYVFGFYTREENAAAFGGSARSYDNDKRRVESWMGEYLSFHQNSAGKSVFLSAAGSSILRNPLYRAFKAKSFTANDIVLHFCLWTCLLREIHMTRAKWQSFYRMRIQ